MIPFTYAAPTEMSLTILSSGWNKKLKKPPMCVCVSGVSVGSDRTCDSYSLQPVAPGHRRCQCCSISSSIQCRRACETNLRSMCPHNSFTCSHLHLKEPNVFYLFVFLCVHMTFSAAALISKLQESQSPRSETEE